MWHGGPASASVPIPAACCGLPRRGPAIPAGRAAGPRAPSMFHAPGKDPRPRSGPRGRGRRAGGKRPAAGRRGRVAGGQSRLPQRRRRPRHGGVRQARSKRGQGPARHPAHVQQGSVPRRPDARRGLRLQDGLPNARGHRDAARAREAGPARWHGSGATAPRVHRAATAPPGRQAHRLKQAGERRW